MEINNNIRRCCSMEGNIFCVRVSVTRSTKSSIRVVSSEEEEEKKKKKNEGTRLPRRKLTKQVDIKGTRAMQIDQRSHVTVRDPFFFFFFFSRAHKRIFLILRQFRNWTKRTIY